MGDKTMVGFIIKRTDIDSTLFLEENAHNANCLFDDDKVTQMRVSFWCTPMMLI